MRVWITRDSNGLVQMWKYKPIKTNDGNNIIFKDEKHNFTGIVINTLYSDDTDNHVCCLEKILM